MVDHFDNIAHSFKIITLKHSHNNNKRIIYRQRILKSLQKCNFNLVQLEQATNTYCAWIFLTISKGTISSTMLWYIYFRPTVPLTSSVLSSIWCVGFFTSTWVEMFVRRELSLFAIRSLWPMANGAVILCKQTIAETIAIGVCFRFLKDHRMNWNVHSSSFFSSSVVSAVVVSFSGSSVSDPASASFGSADSSSATLSASGLASSEGFSSEALSDSLLAEKKEKFSSELNS